MAKQCASCGKNIGALSLHFKLGDGNIVCASCLKKVGMNVATVNLLELRNLTIDDFNDNDTHDESTKDIAFKRMILSDNLIEAYMGLSKVASLNLDPVLFDDDNRLLMIKGSLTVQPRRINYFELTGYSDTTVGTSRKKHHGITRAVVGSAIDGGVGAIVGAVTGGKQYDVITKMALTLNLTDNRFEEITFIKKEIKTDSKEYLTQLDIYKKVQSKLDSIIQENTEPAPAQLENTSEADEILKFKNLMDQGIITPDDFEAKKKQLLKL
ncbi:SHOCT domain-containing protein [Paucilactobacillus nenjiangensis]|uniref:SHOCT domain-containing protein n=1 Tax=Paucilactobacillus nenjiangensis TaxID=1296540 RepID=UPI003BB4DE5F